MNHDRHARPRPAFQWSLATRFAATVLGLGVLLAGPVACGDSELGRSCAQDTDCKKVDSCCDGCVAVNVAEVGTSCDAECIQSACASTQQEDFVAVCKQGACELVLPSN